MANECWWQLHKFRPTDFSCCNKNSARSETTRASLNLDIWWSSFVEQLNFREAFSILHHWSNLLDLLLTKKKTTGIEYLPNSSYLGITQSLLYYAVVPLHISLTRGEILKFVISILPDYRTLSNDCSLYFLWSVNFHTILKDNLTALMPEKSHRVFSFFFFFSFLSIGKAIFMTRNLSLPFIKHLPLPLQINTELNSF